MKTSKAKEEKEKASSTPLRLVDISEVKAAAMDDDASLMLSLLKRKIDQRKSAKQRHAQVVLDVARQIVDGIDQFEFENMLGLSGEPSQSHPVLAKLVEELYAASSSLRAETNPDASKNDAQTLKESVVSKLRDLVLSEMAQTVEARRLAAEAEEYETRRALAVAKRSSESVVTTSEDGASVVGRLERVDHWKSPVRAIQPKSDAPLQSVLFHEWHPTPRGPVCARCALSAVDIVSSLVVLSGALVETPHSGTKYINGETWKHIGEMSLRDLTHGKSVTRDRRTSVGRPKTMYGEVLTEPYEIDHFENGCVETTRYEVIKRDEMPACPAGSLLTCSGLKGVVVVVSGSAPQSIRESAFY